MSSISVVSRHPSRPDSLIPSRDFPIGIDSEGNGRDENLCVIRLKVPLNVKKLKNWN